MLTGAPDDFDHDMETFSTIGAELVRRHAIVNTLSTKPESFEPLFLAGPTARRIAPAKPSESAIERAFPTDRTAGILSQTITVQRRNGP
ncbi:MAG: hypothetical protein ABR970_20190 [Roseiarcus sp.]|jgi:hypothetical protein